MDLKLDHHNEDRLTVVDVEGEIDVYTAPRLRELLIDLVNKSNYHLVVNMEKVEFLDSTGLGVLVGGLKRVRAHDGSLELVCTQERILKIFRITGLTKVFGIHDSVDEAKEARRPRQVVDGHRRADVQRPARARAHGAAGRHRGRHGAAASTESLLDEVRLAVGEACSRAVEAHRAPLPGRADPDRADGRRERFEVAVTDSAPSDELRAGTRTATARRSARAASPTR